MSKTTTLGPKGWWIIFKKIAGCHKILVDFHGSCSQFFSGCLSQSQFFNRAVSKFNFYDKAQSLCLHFFWLFVGYFWLLVFINSGLMIILPDNFIVVIFGGLKVIWCIGFCLISIFWNFIVILRCIYTVVTWRGRVVGN